MLFYIESLRHLSYCILGNINDQIFWTIYRHGKVLGKPLSKTIFNNSSIHHLSVRRAEKVLKKLSYLFLCVSFCFCCLFLIWWGHFISQIFFYNTFLFVNIMHTPNWLPHLFGILLKI